MSNFILEVCSKHITVDFLEFLSWSQASPEMYILGGGGLFLCYLSDIRTAPCCHYEKDANYLV